jgi:serine/threonine protein kinase
MKKNKEGVVKFEDECWNSFSVEAMEIAKAMLNKDPAKRITAKGALSHPWFFVQHNAQTRFPTTQDKMNKYNGINRFKIERIKPEFVMKYYTPLLQPVSNRPLTTYKTPQFPAKLIENWNGENVTEGRKVLNKVIFMRTLNEKGEINDNEMNFKGEDIDEPSLGLKVIAAIESSIKHKKDSIMPSSILTRQPNDTHNRVRMLNTMKCREVQMGLI